MTRRNRKNKVSAFQPKEPSDAAKGQNTLPELADHFQTHYFQAEIQKTVSFCSKMDQNVF